MRKSILYPYTLEKKGNVIKLEIMSNKRYGLLYIAVIIMSAISMAGCTFSLFWNRDFPLKDYLILIYIIIGCILFILLAFYLLKWEREGKEIFILYPNKLEKIVAIKPLKTEKHTFNLNKLEIGCQSGEDFYSEEEAKELGIELDLEKVEGNYSIQFYMDERVQVVDSEREIPIDVIRRIKKEYLLNQNDENKEV